MYGSVRRREGGAEPRRREAGDHRRFDCPPRPPRDPHFHHHPHLPPVPGGQPVEKWFLSKFCSGKCSAYQFLLDEFDWLQSCPEAGVSRNQIPFVKPRKNLRTIQAPSFSVNAHYVEGWAGRRYICCEGPNSSSTYDFWEMVWQEEVTAILMLNTPFEERLFPKTYNPSHETIQYWPLGLNETKHFAPWKIVCMSTALKSKPGDPGSLSASDPRVVYRISTLTLVVQENNPITRPKPREIIHICYYRWPDGEIPLPPVNDPQNYEATAMGLVELMREELGHIMGPIVVHCHAGIGRTGVAVALDIAVSRLLARRFADVRDTVRRIREQRPKSVMNVWQYAYINLALARLAFTVGLLPSHPSLFNISPLPPGIRPHPSEMGKWGIGNGLPTTGPGTAALLDTAWRDLAFDFNDVL